MSGQRRAGYDCARAVCAVTVALFHYGTTCEAMGLHGFSDRLIAYAGGTWGELASLVFLMLSGAALTCGYPAGSFSLAGFYKKRWLSLYPLYYLAYVLAAVWLLFYFPGYFNAATPASLLLSALGMDGYFSYRCAGSYILGEWFLGAIVLLYLLYPLLAWALEHRFARAAVSVVLPLASFLVIRHGWFGIYYGIYGLHNLWLCAFLFWCGMLFEKYHVQLARLFRLLPALGTVLLAVTVLKPLGINLFYTMTAGALGTFPVLVFLGDALQGCRGFTAFCRWVGRQSYALLLVHHVLFQQGLVRLFGAFASTLPACLLGLCAALALARLLNALYALLRGVVSPKEVLHE